MTTPAIVPSAPTRNGPAAAAPSSKVTVSCCPAGSPVPRNGSTRPATAPSRSTSRVDGPAATGASTVGATTPGPAVEGGAALEAPAPGAAGASSASCSSATVTGVKVSLLPLATPWAPTVMIPQVTSRQSTVRSLLDRS
ncbi:hypothetical protein [Nocardioides zeae]